MDFDIEIEDNLEEQQIQELLARVFSCPPIGIVVDPDWANLPSTAEVACKVYYYPDAEFHTRLDVSVLNVNLIKANVMTYIDKIAELSRCRVFVLGLVKTFNPYIGVVITHDLRYFKVLVDREALDGDADQGVIIDEDYGQIDPNSITRDW